jgi:hypothetical protein
VCSLDSHTVSVSSTDRGFSLGADMVMVERKMSWREREGGTYEAASLLSLNIDCLGERRHLGLAISYEGSLLPVIPVGYIIACCWSRVRQQH